MRALHLNTLYRAVDFENYDDKAAQYDEIRQVIGSQALLAKLCEYLPDFPTRTVLDVGCGTGLYMKWLTENGFNGAYIEGIEPNAAMRTIAQQKNHVVHEGRIEELKQIVKKKFDLVLCCEVLHHLEIHRRQDAIQDMFDVLKPNGVLLIQQTTREQTQNAFMYSVLIDNNYKILNRFPTKSDVETSMSMFSSCIEIVTPLEENDTLQRNHTTTGMWNDQMLKTDSTWTLIDSDLPINVDVDVSYVKSMIKEYGQASYFFGCKRCPRMSAEDINEKKQLWQTLQQTLGKSSNFIDKSSNFIDKFMEVPRHHFVPSDDEGIAQRKSYEDRPQTLIANQTISQPSLVAKMIRLLEIEETDELKILEIGTGFGYNACAMARIAPNAKIVTMEIVPSLCEESKKRRCCCPWGKHIKFICGDGNHPVDENGTQLLVPYYDRIIVTADARSSQVEKLKKFLNVGGIMVVPEKMDHGRSELKRYRRNAEKEEETSHGGVSFVPFL